MDLDLEAYLTTLGPAAEEQLKTALRDGWDKLGPFAQTKAKAAVLDLLRLGFQKLRGDDVSRELAFARASVENVASLGLDVTSDALKQGIYQAAGLVGEVLLNVLKGMAKGAL